MASHPTQRISTAQIGHRIIRAALVAVVGLHGLRVDCIARHRVVLALAALANSLPPLLLLHGLAHLGLVKRRLG